MLTKKTKKLWIILNLLSEFCLIICLVLDSILIWSTKFSASNVLDIKDNFDSYPIFDFEGTDYCESKRKLIVIDKWPGTIRGCDCTSMSLALVPYEKKIMRGSCSGIMANCKEINPLKEVKLTKWRGKNFCQAIKDENYTYYSLLLSNSVKENETCKIGFKKCGYLDTLKQILCLPENEECPINFIKVSTSGPPVECMEKECKKISLKGKGDIYFSNKIVTGYVVSQFKVSDSNVCLNVDEYDSNNVRYELDYYSYYGCKTKYSSKIYDDRYILLDSENKYKFYQENGIISKVSELNEYPLDDIKASTINLYHKTFSGFDLQCLLNNGFNPKNLGNFESNTKTSKNINISIFVAILLNIIFQFSFIIWTLCSRKRHSNQFLWPFL